MRLVKSERRPTESAIDQGDGLWLVTDEDAKKKGVSENVVPDDDIDKELSQRSDLPSTHPHYRKRMVKVVPAGSRDIFSDDLKGNGPTMGAAEVHR